MPSTTPIIEIDLNEIQEPMLCLPERPGRCQVRCPPWLGTKIDEVFIGSCMTNIGHFRAASEAAQAG